MIERAGAGTEPVTACTQRILLKLCGDAEVLRTGVVALS
jgi:hypothetical protein